MLTREQVIRAINDLPDADVALIGSWIEYLNLCHRPVQGERPIVKLSGRWKDAFPPDFDVEEALAALRRNEQEMKGKRICQRP